MVISEIDLEYIQKVRALGDDNVHLNGSILLNIIGIKRAIGDIDTVVTAPTPEQESVINEYKQIQLADVKNGGNKYLVDFLRGRNEYADSDSGLRYKGIPVGNLEAMIKAKIKYSREKDYKDLNLLMKWVLEKEGLDIDKDKSLLTIINNINYGN